MTDDVTIIDVQYDKLIEWLVDRKKIGKDWRAKLAVVHLKLSDLARGLPGRLTRASGVGVPDPSLTDNSGEPARWDYHRARLVRDLIVAGADLTGSEKVDGTDSSEAADRTDGPGAGGTVAVAPDTGDDPQDGAFHKQEDSADVAQPTQKPTRGYFGRLAGAAKAWDDIVKTYEKECLHLSEAGLLLVKVTEYDAPYYANQSAKMVKQLSDLDRREVELKRSARASRARFAKKCKDVGVARETTDFAAAIAELTKGLDGVFEQAATLAKGKEIGQAAEHYARWTQWAHVPKTVGVEKQQVTFATLLPALWRLRLMSDAECDAFRDECGLEFREEYSEVSTSTETDAPGIVAPPVGGIDWDLGVAAVDVGVVEPPAGSIDWDLGGAGDENETNETDVVEIQWDVSDVVSIEQDDVDLAGGAEPVEIDWGVSADVVVENVGGGERYDERKTVSTDSCGVEDSPDDKKGNAFFLGRVLSYRQFRNAVLDDLLELRSFLAQRAFDSSSSETVALLSTAPNEVTRNFSNSEELKNYATFCEAPVELLGTDTVQRLLLIAASCSYRTRVGIDLRTAKLLESKFMNQVADVEKKREETRRLLKRESAKLAAIKKSTAEVKQFVEEVIGKMYKGTAVHVIGNVNKVLSG